MRYLTMALFGLFTAAAAPAEAPLVLDDFRSSTPTWGTRWEGFTDRVMGGLTSMKAGVVDEAGDRFLRLEGRVRTENNGGFLQMRLVLEKGGRPLDARPWSGVRLVVLGLPGSYAIHLRTAQNWFPWQFYTAPLPVTADWTEVRLPFAGFKGDYGAWGEAELKTLKGVAVVAIGEAFDARLDVKELGLYP